jgi:hypothetical protein
MSSQGISVVQLAKGTPFLLRDSCYRAARSYLPVSLYPYSVTVIKVADKMSCSWIQVLTRILIMSLKSEIMVIASSSFDGLGPLASSRIRINLKAMTLTECCQDSLDGVSARRETAA